LQCVGKLLREDRLVVERDWEEVEFGETLRSSWSKNSFVASSTQDGSNRYLSYKSNTYPAFGPKNADKLVMLKFLPQSLKRSLKIVIDS
jgi:hypothetical protein